MFLENYSKYVDDTPSIHHTIKNSKKLKTITILKEVEKQNRMY